MSSTDPMWYLGRADLGGSLFGLAQEDRRQHLYVVGKTGTGKTTLLRNCLVQDIEAGRGCGLIDPHGDLAEELLDYIPPWRADDVVYFNPTDLDYPIGFNLLQRVPRDQQHLVASGVVSVFKSIWSDSWGPRMEHILYSSLAALLSCENVSLLGLSRMLVDARYREWVVRQVKDPVVRSFWQDEFARYEPRFLREAIAPIQNKVGQLLMAPPVRHILGSLRRRIDPGFMMDNRRIFLANLAKGKLGAEKANLLGAVLVTSFQLAAMARSSVPEDEREDFSLVIDEFHNFSTDSFAAILSEARKYRLSLTLSHQYLDQVDRETQDAVLGNVGTIASFRVGERDAERLSGEFGREWPARAFTRLGNYEVLVRLMEQGAPVPPFLGRSLPSVGSRYGRGENLIRVSRQKYGTPRSCIEDQIARWLGR